MDSLAIFVLVIVAGGVSLAALAAFSRRQNARLRERGYIDWKTALHRTPASPGEALAVLFSGPLPKTLERLGNGLAIATVAAVIITVIVITVAIAAAKGFFG